MSPAPVVSTSLAIGKAGTCQVSPPLTITQPFSERVTTPSTPSARRLSSASSKFGVWYSDRISSVLAKIVSTVRERMSSMNSPRNRFDAK